MADERGAAMVDFKDVHFPKEAILYAVFFYLRYPGFYRDLEEIMEERGVDVDHGTLNRWVVKFAPLMAAQAAAKLKKRLGPTSPPKAAQVLPMSRKT
jgi:transposase-like protein